MTTIRDFGDQRVWRKSSRSADQGGSCLYVTVDESGQVTTGENGLIGIRDSKLGNDGPVLWFAPKDFEGLLNRAAE
jgi:hypothetical protein